MLKFENDHQNNTRKRQIERNEKNNQRNGNRRMMKEIELFLIELFCSVKFLSFVLFKNVLFEELEIQLELFLEIQRNQNEKK